MTKAELITEISNLILTGGRRTTAVNVRQVLTDIVNSYSDGITATSSIVAFAAGGQGSATALTATYNFIDTVAATDASVKVLAATANAFQYIQNNGANNLNVYPQTGENFKDMAANDPISVPPGGQLTITCAVAGEWRYF